MKTIVTFVLAISLSSLAWSQQVEVIKFSQLEEYLNQPSPNIRIVNFWATWCRPCVKELPFFQSYYAANQANGVEMLLVSLDFVEDLEKVKAFVEKRGLTAKVNLLDETDYNSFIDKIDPRWSGAIPATILMKGDKRLFVEKELKEGELEKWVSQLE